MKFSIEQLMDWVSIKIECTSQEEAEILFEHLNSQILDTGRLILTLKDVSIRKVTL